MTVDGTAVSGKNYEQAVKMIRGEAGTVVKLGIKCDGETRELSITRMAGDKLSKGSTGSHGNSIK
jgi:C-terminal processing protease CtpA/Prc